MSVRGGVQRTNAGWGVQLERKVRDMRRAAGIRCVTSRPELPSEVRESLYALDSLRKVGDLSIDAIGPGGDRIYLVGRVEQCETEAPAIQSNREKESLRTGGCFTANRL